MNNINAHHSYWFVAMHRLLRGWHIYVAQWLLLTDGLHSCIANSLWKHLTWLDFGFPLYGKYYTFHLATSGYLEVSCVKRSAGELRLRGLQGYGLVAVCRHRALLQWRRSSTTHCQVEPLSEWEMKVRWRKTTGETLRILVLNKTHLCDIHLSRSWSLLVQLLEIPCWRY